MIKLNIYKNENGSKIIEKTYEATEFDLMFGTVEDILNLMNVGDAKNDTDLMLQIARNVGKCCGQLRPLLMDVFPGLTDEELTRTKVKEIVTVVMTILKNALN